MFGRLSVDSALEPMADSGGNKTARASIVEPIKVERPVHSAANVRLATYGTLSPGQANHHQLAGLVGIWQTGTVKGWLFPEAWGAASGYPGIVLDPEGTAVEVQLFQSDDLPDHWARLDAFEGDGYRRVVTQVTTAAGALEACIYVLTADRRPADPET